MTSKLLAHFKQSIKNYTLIPSKGGCFELKVGEQLLYSKLKTRQFPNENEMLAAVGKALGQ